MANEEIESKFQQGSSTDDDDFSIVEGLAGAVRLDDDIRITPEEKAALVQDLYVGPPKCQCCINWVTEQPKGLDLTVKEPEPEDDSHPLILRRRVSPRVPGSKGPTIFLESIEVRNPEARASLYKVFEGWDNIVSGFKYLVFTAPFRPFYYCWDKFEAVIAEEENESVKRILQMLRIIVRAELAETFAVSKELQDAGIISSKYLWTIFKPGELVYSTAGGVERVYIVTAITFTYRGHHIDCQYIGWDGYFFGWMSHTIDMYNFHETVPISSLRAVPVRFLPEWETEIWPRLLARGKKYRDLAGCYYKACVTQTVTSTTYQKPDASGNPDRTLLHQSGNRRASTNVRRIMVDARKHPKRSRTLNFAWTEAGLRKSSGGISQTPVGLPPPGGHRPLVQPLPGMSNAYNVPGTTSIPAKAVPPPRGPPPPHYLGSHPPPPTSVINIDEINPPLPGGPRRPVMPPAPRAAPPPPGLRTEELRRLRVRRREDREERRRRGQSVSSSSSSSYDSDEEATKNVDPEMLPGGRGWLTETMLVLCTHEILGFCLREKAWRTFHVDDIVDIEFNEEPFESLVLPDGYKELVLSFVESQLQHGDSFDDVINGKGKHLFNGPPVSF